MLLSGNICVRLDLNNSLNLCFSKMCPSLYLRYVTAHVVTSVGLSEGMRGICNIRFIHASIAYSETGFITLVVASACSNLPPNKRIVIKCNASNNSYMSM